MVIVLIVATRLEHQVARLARGLDRLRASLDRHRLAFGHRLKLGPRPAQPADRDVVAGVGREVEGTSCLVRIPRHVDVDHRTTGGRVALNVQPEGVGLRQGRGRADPGSEYRQNADHEEEASAHHDGPLGHFAAYRPIRGFGIPGFRATGWTACHTTTWWDGASYPLAAYTL